mgnify:CR=1 FL=1
MKAYIFPGQGAQFEGIGKDLYDAHKEARDLFAEADNILNYKDLQNLPGNPGRVGYINFQIHF